MVKINNLGFKTSSILAFNYFGFNNYGMQQGLKRNNSFTVVQNNKVNNNINKKEDNQLKNINNKSILDLSNLKIFKQIVKDPQTLASIDLVYSILFGTISNVIEINKNLIFPQQCNKYSIDYIKRLGRLGGSASYYFAGYKYNTFIFIKTFSKSDIKDKIGEEWNICKEFAVCNFLSEIGIKNITKPISFSENNSVLILEYPKYEYDLCDFVQDNFYQKFEEEKKIKEQLIIEEQLNIKNEENNFKCLLLVIRDIINGLRGIHSANIVHLDIKPENIMINKRITNDNKKLTEGVIIDFGNSQLYNRETSSILGTYEFLHPDIIKTIRGKGFYDGKKADLFALGVTLLFSFFYCNDSSLFKCKGKKDVIIREECYCPIIFFGYQYISNKDIKGFKTYLNFILESNKFNKDLYNDFLTKFLLATNCEEFIKNLYNKYAPNVEISFNYNEICGLLKFKRLLDDKKYDNLYNSLIDVISNLIVDTPTDCNYILKSNFYKELNSLL